jgi:predicted phage terminase large subunit-like protein
VLAMVNKVRRLEQQAGQIRQARSSVARLEPGSLLEFIPRISPRFEAPYHLRPLIERLEQIPQRPQKLIVSVPPRHSKSESLLHFIAHFLVRRPELRVAYCSYAQTFSETQALKAHRYARAAGVQANTKMANRKDWQTSAGGGIFATGVGGEFTGRGADLLIIDDPISNREQADSPTYRNKLWSWFEDVAETRYEPGASGVVLMTRWHEDDFSGRLIKHRPGEYEVIRIPALADGLDALGHSQAPDPLGRALDVPLWPERYGFEALDKIRREKPYTFASLYQGLPRPKEGRLFDEPTLYQRLPSSYRVVIGADLAYSAKARADHSSVVVFFVTTVDGREIWFVKHVERWQESINQSLERLARLQKQYAGAPIAIEANGPQKAVADLLEDRGVRITRIHRVSDKYSEAQAFAEAWNAGRVQLPEGGAPWLGEYLEELHNFSGVAGAQDDQVDASVNGYEDSPDLDSGAKSALTGW